MAGRESGSGRMDSVTAVRSFIADWKAGRAGGRELRAVAGDLETVRGRLERVRAACPQAGVALGEEVDGLLKLLGRQRSVAKPRLANLRRAAAGLL